jgi:peptide/nickel transport system permease protein
LGYPDFRILWKHIMPQAVAPLIVLAASQFASAILLESGLSFLGLGAQPPMPSWGGMIRDHYAYLLTGQAHLALVPGVALAMLVLAFQVLGTALRDVLDVRK